MNRKLIFWVLGASLALNLFLLGFMAARGLKGPRGLGSRGMPHAEGGPFKVWHVLQQSQKPELRAKLRTELKQMRPARKALREAQSAVQKSLEAEPFDANKLSSALDKLQAETSKNQSRMHALMVDIAKELTPQERKMLAKENWRGPGGGRGDGRLKGPPGPGGGPPGRFKGPPPQE